MQQGFLLFLSRFLCWRPHAGRCHSAPATIFVIMKPFFVVLMAFAMALNSWGDPPNGASRPTPEIKLLLGQPLSAWTSAYGEPKSNRGKDAAFQTSEGTAYVILGSSGLTECASFVANIADLNHLVDIVTQVC